MTTYKIEASPGCQWCHGRGVTEEHHPWGSTYATEYLICDCVLDQLPEGFDDYKDSVEPIAFPFDDGPEFEYDW